MRAKFLARWTSLCVIGTLTWAVGLMPVSSVSAQDKAQATVDEQTLAAKDGWRIRVTYFKSALGKDAPVVVLLHALGKGRNRLAWRVDVPGQNKDFAKLLHDEGYAVITVDLRKHGQSKAAGVASAAGSDSSSGPLDLKPDDYRAMVLADLEAVKDLIFEEHQKQNLNMRKMGIIAAEDSAPLAIAFALRDWLKKPYPDAPTLAASTPRGQDVRALVLLSPEENLPGVRSGPALLRLRNPSWGVSFLIGYGDKDRGVERTARGVYQKVTGKSANKDRVYLQPYGVKLQGTDLLGKKLRVEAHILGFLKKHLMELPDEWRNRKSRLD